VPDEENEANRYEVGVPQLGSLIITHELDGEIRDSKRCRAINARRSHRVLRRSASMVGIGVLM